MNEREPKTREATLRGLDNIGKYLCAKCGYHGYAKLRGAKLASVVAGASLFLPMLGWLLPDLPDGDFVCPKCGTEFSSEDYEAGYNYTPP